MKQDGAIPAFRLTGVSYAYLGRFPAVREVDLVVEQGESVVILGANGCGKSTLLKIMDALHRPDRGVVEFMGEDFSAAAEDPSLARSLHRSVGLVFQDSDVQLFSPTVWEDVAFGPLQMGWTEPEIQRRVLEALGLMEVAGLADRAPYELSEGEKKRVAIATVLVLDPDVILMDEPTASLDPRSKALLVELIGRLRLAGKTLVSTTQELDVAAALGDRAIVFGGEERRPVASGPVSRILEDTELLVRANLIHPRLMWRR